MSVINTMLRKLEARGAGTRGASAAGAPDGTGGTAAWSLPAAAAPRRAAPRWRLPAIALGGVALIALTAFADWPRLMQAPPPSPVAMAADAASPHEAPALAGPAADSPPPAPANAVPPAPVVAAPPAATAVARTATLGTTAHPQPATTAPAAAPSDPMPAPALPASLATPVAMPPRIDKRPAAPSPTQRAQELYRDAAAQAQAGQRRPALERAHAALAQDPTHAASRQLAALLEHEAAASGRAAQLLVDGLAIAPADTAMAMLLARVRIAQGAHADALAVLDRHGVTGAEADGLRGGVFAQLGDYAGARAAYDRAVRQQPAQPMWWFGLAVALDGEGQAGTARQAYARAQALGLPRPDLAAYASQRLAALD